MLTIATEGDPATGDLVFFLYDPTTKTVQQGTAEGLAPATDVTVSPTGKVTAAPGLTILNIAEAASRPDDIKAMVIPTADGAIKASGLSKAFEGNPTADYDACLRLRHRLDDRGRLHRGQRRAGSSSARPTTSLSQGWLVGVGIDNFVRTFTDPAVAGPILGIMGWNFAFAIITVLITFGAGLLVAVTLNTPRLRGLRFYRVLIILPYAMPSFAMLLVWRDMFNADFGLVNTITGLNVNWYGNVWTARFAILAIQFWLGYPYMFLVCLGALQSIPQDMTEAAAVDGARPYQAFRAVVFPLLLVAVAPLLIASFAFNFNNFNVIELTTGGAPFPPDNPKAGGTDILVSYVYRLAFAEGGAQYGFAAAVSVIIFVIVAAVSIIGFRRTAALEEINR